MNPLTYYTDASNVRCAYKDIELMLNARLSKKALSLYEAFPNELLIGTVVIIDDTDTLTDAQASMLYSTRGTRVIVVRFSDLVDAIKVYNAAHGLPTDDKYINSCIAVNHGLTWTR